MRRRFRCERLILSRPRRCIFHPAIFFFFPSHSRVVHLLVSNKRFWGLASNSLQLLTPSLPRCLHLAHHHGSLLGVNGACQHRPPKQWVLCCNMVGWLFAMPRFLAGRASTTAANNHLSDGQSQSPRGRGVWPQEDDFWSSGDSGEVTATLQKILENQKPAVPPRDGRGGQKTN